MKTIINNFISEEHKLNKKQFLAILCTTIIIAGTFGWIYEFFFYFIESGFKEFYYRGGNFLPWINIYAYGALLIILLTYKFRKKPWLVFLIAAISCGVLEYFSGYFYYKINGMMCWDYNVERFSFGSIGGFVCLRSVLIFGISGLFLMYFVLPLLFHIAKTKNVNKFLTISVIFCSIILIDEIYNLIFTELFGLPRASEIYKKIGFKYKYFRQ